jgi:hypothetical protein
MSGVGKHQANFWGVAIAHGDGLAEVTLTVRSFLRKNVTGECLMTPDLACPADFEALCRASMRF